MTIKELRDMLNKIDTKYDNEKIYFWHEEDGGGSICEGAWFDMQCYTYCQKDMGFSITTCLTKEDLENHCVGIEWTEDFDDEDFQLW